MNDFDLINKAKSKLKESDTFKDLCKEFDFAIDDISLIPVYFGELDISASTDHGIICLNEKLKDDSKAIEHYLIHEIRHFFDQTHGDGPTYGSTKDSYLDNEYEQVAFKEQSKYISERDGDIPAEKYIEKVLDHHKVPNSERAERRKELTELANKKEGLIKFAGIFQAPPVYKEIYEWIVEEIAGQMWTSLLKEAEAEKEASKIDGKVYHSDKLFSINREIEFCQRFVDSPKPIKRSDVREIDLSPLIDWKYIKSVKELDKLKEVMLRVVVYFDSTSVPPISAEGWSGLYEGIGLFKTIYIKAFTDVIDNLSNFNNFLLNLEETIIHEVGHLGQELMSIVKGLSNIGGLPGKVKQEVDIHGRPKIKEKYTEDLYNEEMSDITNEEIEKIAEEFNLLALGLPVYLKVEIFKAFVAEEDKFKEMGDKYIEESNNPEAYNIINNLSKYIKPKLLFIRLQRAPNLWSRARTRLLNLTSLYKYDVFKDFTISQPEIREKFKLYAQIGSELLRKAELIKKLSEDFPYNIRVELAKVFIGLPNDFKELAGKYKEETAEPKLLKIIEGFERNAGKLELFERLKEDKNMWIYFAKLFINEVGGIAEHQLRDVEFYPSLVDEVSIFRSKFRNIRNDDELIKEAVKWFIVDNNNFVNMFLAKYPTSNIAKMKPSHFFQVLKERDINRWKKAAKEFYKAVGI